MNISTTDPSTSSEQHKIDGSRATRSNSTLIVATVTFQLTASMVTPALPQMAAALGEGPAGAAPLQSMFFLSAAIAVPVFRRWSDFIGRRAAMLAALGTVVAGTILCIVAQTLPLLVIEKILQGAGGAMFTLAYIVLNENLNTRVFGVSLGIVAAISGGVGGLDGFAGGGLTEAFGYKSIFVVVLFVAAIAAVCILKVVPQGRPQGVSGRMDWWGAGSLSVFLIFLTNFVSVGSSAGWTSAISLALLVGTVVSFGVFWAIEKRRRHPLIAVSYLRSRQFWPVVATSLLALAGMFAMLNFTVVVLSQDLPTWLRTKSLPCGPAVPGPTSSARRFHGAPGRLDRRPPRVAPNPAARSSVQSGLRHYRSGFLRQSLCGYFRCCRPWHFLHRLSLYKS